MATRSIFKHNSSTSEQNLISSLVEESIQIVGFDAMYLPRITSNVDPLTQDAGKTEFSRASLLEMYFENPEDGYGDSVDYISEFGFEVRDSASLVFSSSRFAELKIPNYNEPVENRPDMVMPLEGDLIYLPFTGSILEISFVEDWVPFFQLGANYLFKTMCRLMVFSNQQFGDSNGVITLYGDGNTPIEVADLTTEQSDALGKISSIDETWNKPVLDDQGVDTGVITSENTFDQSDIFQEPTDYPDLLDITEINPFGEF